MPSCTICRGQQTERPVEGDAQRRPSRHLEQVDAAPQEPRREPREPDPNTRRPRRYGTRAHELALRVDDARLRRLAGEHVRDVRRACAGLPHGVLRGLRVGAAARSG